MQIFERCHKCHVGYLVNWDGKSCVAIGNKWDTGCRKIRRVFLKEFTADTWAVNNSLPEDRNFGECACPSGKKYIVFCDPAKAVGTQLNCSGGTHGPCEDLGWNDKLKKREATCGAVIAGSGPAHYDICEDCLGGFSAGLETIFKDDSTIADPKNSSVNLKIIRCAVPRIDISYEQVEVKRIGVTNFEVSWTAKPDSQANAACPRRYSNFLTEDRLWTRPVQPC